jgi:hypothetical protein
VVGDHQEVQRTLKPGAHAHTGHDLLSAREAVGLLRPEPATHHAGIGGIRGVHMRIAEIDAVGKAPVEVGRILLLPIVTFLGETSKSCEDAVNVSA